MTGAAFLLLNSGVAGAAQVLLDGSTIPKYVEPLPVAGNITVVNATSIRRLAGIRAQNARRKFPIAAMEFQSQILPTLANWPGAPATCMDETRLTPSTASWAWGYLTPGDNPGQIRDSYLGPVVVAERGVPFMPLFQNRLPYFGYVQQNYQIDMTLDWANPDGIDCGKVGGYAGETFPDSDVDDHFTNPLCGADQAYMGEIPIATHLHGGEVAPAFDGGPDAWFTQDFAKTGLGWPGQVYEYPNEQQESTIWFHDHGLGVTRLNVYAGLAGLYPIIDLDPANAPAETLPAFPQYDIPLILQDRSFDTNCELFYNLASNPQPNPLVHPRWIPEFIGDTIAVNGKTWPYLEVEPRQYRFRFVNGSNARFYNLTLDNEADFIVIATDDGYLENAVATSSLTIGPGERYEVIVDFSGEEMDTEIIMMNDALTPFPDGDSIPGDGNDADEVMKFIVNQDLSDISDTDIEDTDRIRAVGNDILPIADGHYPATGSITRQLTLNEVSSDDYMGVEGGPLELVVNNSKFNLALPTPGCPPGSPSCRETELPGLGDTEIWEIINISADAHPMHTHLVSFQILARIPFKTDEVGGYAEWVDNYASEVALYRGPGEGPPYTYNMENADGAIGGNPPVHDFLDTPNPPSAYEMGWKDTVIAYPGEVTRIAVRWDTTDTPVPGDAAAAAAAVGDSDYPFDPTVLSGGVGYVWHCHIIDHEDNEMMRNYVVGPERQPVVPYAP